MSQTQSRQARSPRQIANKAYSLATKKISFDDRRKRPHYHLRERLMIQHTMRKAKRVLSPNESFSMRVLVHPYDTCQTPTLGSEQAQHFPPPPALPLTFEAPPFSSTTFLPPLPSQSSETSSIKEEDTPVASEMTPTISATITPKSSFLVYPSFHISNSILHYIQWSFTNLLKHFTPSFFWPNLFVPSIGPSSNPRGKRSFFFVFPPLFQTPTHL
ncbi:hypothetical protein [Absidia glauca]|uniref:Uncharacterized protein n=1 Tax=Absidia glauca TaxID=4829 RepID=A0A163IWV7_ABSGL|nr:hypothetical protein [Absidia glauca]